MKEPLKIFHIITRLNVGGAAVCNLLLAEEQVASGHDVTIITGVAEKEEGEMLELLKDRSYPFTIYSIPELRKPLDISEDLISFLKLWYLIRKNNPDVVHTHLSKAGLLGRIAAFLSCVPVVIHSNHGALFRSYFGPVLSFFIVAAERSLSLLCDRVFVATEAMRKDILSARAATPSKLEVIPLGLDLSPFLDLSDQKDILRHRFTLKAKKLVGTAARLSPVKAIDDFIIAAKAVCDRTTDVDFVIAGDGEMRLKLEGLAQSLGIADRVHFIGFLADMRPFYEAIDIFVVTSIAEGTCISVLEAITARKPVIATEVGGIPDAVKDGVNGFLFTPHDVMTLSRRMMEVIDNPNQIPTSGDVAFTNIISRYSVAARTHQMETIYRRVLEEKRRRKKPYWWRQVVNILRRPLSEIS